MKDFIWEGEMDLKICDDLLEFYDTCTYLQKHEYSGKTHSRGKISTDIHCHTMLARNEPRLDAYLSKLTELFGSYFVEYPAAGQIDCHIDPMFNIGINLTRVTLYGTLKEVMIRLIVRDVLFG